ncbi:MAG: dUTP diphosphatase [Armatimonadetes bacterium]|nr:dUTP diphosphatase [Armatimonadota bacterium]
MPQDLQQAIDTVVRVEARHPGALLPRKANPTDACHDLFIPEEAVVPARGTAILDLGIGVQLEPGWEMQIRGRSGLATRGFVVHPGTLDHLYRENVKLIVFNHTDQEMRFEPGQRLAQMKIERVWNVDVVEAPVERTTRGGLGSTGQ